jgi:hypothetical protein
MRKTIFTLTVSMVCAHAMAQDIDCRAVDARLDTLAGADQEIRRQADVFWQTSKVVDAGWDALRARWRAIDGDNLSQLKAIVAACGWPASAKGSHSAWLLAQHADGDIPFQRQARALLEAAVKNGAGAPRDLAYLADRIAANEHRPQEYGTQFAQDDRCHLAILPVDDIALVNRRRLAIGLQRLEDYEAEARRRFIPADCARHERE